MWVVNSGNGFIMKQYWDKCLMVSWATAVYLLAAVSAGGSFSIR
jgi:hypothetical protein